MNIDLITTTIAVLTWLSIITILFFLIVLPSDVLYAGLYTFVNQYGFMMLDQRNYGGIVFPCIYFHTTPLLVIPIGYFTYKLCSKFDLRTFTLLAINVTGMFLSGTRNNMFMAIFVCLLVWFYYVSPKKKIVFLFLGMMIGGLLINIALPILQDMFSSSDVSNSIKLNHLKSYWREFEDWKVLIWGAGLGSYFYSDGVQKMVSNTELTYFEIFRRYGLFVGTFLLSLMYYPLTAIRKKNHEYSWLFLSYACFLIMISFNPFYFSSTGMSIFSIVLNKVAQLNSQKDDFRMYAHV